MPYTPDLIANCLNAGVSDEYRFKSLKFTPDVIYDLGADCGSITLYAHKLFPAAKIVAVEPHPEGHELLVKHAKDIPQIVPVHAAIGEGQMYEPANAEPLHWLVVSKASPTWNERLLASSVPSVTLAALYEQHGGERFVVKFDMESAEYALLTHQPSREVLHKAAYVTAEMHVWGTTHVAMIKARDAYYDWLWELAQTHTLQMTWYGACMMVWATNRTIPRVTA